MAQIKELGSSTYTTIADSEVAAALMNPANNVEQNDTLLIDKVPYQFSTLIMGNAGGSLPPVLLGTVTAVNINAGAATASFEKTLTSFPAGQGSFLTIIKVITPFVSPTRDTADFKVDTVTPPVSAPLQQAAGQYNGLVGSTSFRDNATAIAIKAVVTFEAAGNNPLDFSAGEVEVWGVLVKIPTV